jgi:hypothetical protein
MKSKLALSAIIAVALLRITAPSQLGAVLIHQWTFNDGTGSDQVGTSNGTNYNGATISGGRLLLNGINQYFRTAPMSQSVTNKTLAVWVTLSNTVQRSCSALTLEATNTVVTVNFFDAVDFAEPITNRWINGSDYFHRTDTVGAAGYPLETSTNQILMTISYGEGMSNSIKIYREGVLYGSYTNNNSPHVFFGGASDVLIGLRHIAAIAQVGTATGNDAYLSGAVDEARIYNNALTATEVANLFSFGPETAPQATTTTVSGLTETTATLNGIVNSNGTPTGGRFEWGPATTPYANTNFLGNLGNSGNLTTNVATAVSGLIPGTTTHFRLVTTNRWGIGAGGDLTFTSLVPFGVTGTIQQAGNIFQLQFSATAGASYTIQASSNLVDWIILTNFVPVTTGTFQFNDLTATNYPQHFYRVSVP